MNYSEQIFKMLGISPNEKFRFSHVKDAIYRITSDLIIELHNDENTWEEIVDTRSTIYSILIGTIKIIKILKPTLEENLAIDYARLCGCEWLAKDRDGRIFGYDKKPEQEGGFWFSSSVENGIYIEVYYPISFLSWEDEEAYYIGE